MREIIDYCMTCGCSACLCGPVHDFRNQEIETLRAKLADALSVLASRGHDADCPARRCAICGMGELIHGVHSWGHVYQVGPCSDACGLERCGVKV